MDASAEPELDWGRLGAMIADARRQRGWDQQELARRSGNSPNTISNYERGRPVKSRRIPTGVTRVEQALGWPAGTAAELLTGGSDPALYQPDLLEEFGVEVAQRSLESTTTVAAPPGLRSARTMELSESGAVAEYAFLRQMRRHRKLHGLSYEDLAARIKEIGGNLEAEQIAGIEIGDRRLALAEADLLARALGSTVQDVLASAFDDVGEEALRAPSNEEELTAQAKAIERRVFEVGAQVNGAAQRARDAQARVEFARREAEQAQLVFQQVSAEKSSLEREYHYLLGRIDSLRSEMGKETIMQEVEEADGEAPKRPVHSRSGNKAGKPYPGSKAQQEEDLRNAAKRLI